MKKPEIEGENAENDGHSDIELSHVSQSVAQNDCDKFAENKKIVHRVGCGHSVLRTNDFNSLYNI